MPLPKSRVQDEGDNLPASSTKSDSTHLASSDVDNQRGKDQFDVTAVEQEEKELILKKLQELALRSEPQASSLRDGTENSPPMHDMHLEEKASAEEQMGSKEKNDDNPCTFCQPTISQLEAEEQIQQLKDQCMMLESMSNPSKEDIDETGNNLFEEEQLDPSDAMYLMGGYDGESWLSTFSLYFPSQDVMK